MTNHRRKIDELEFTKIKTFYQNSNYKFIYREISANHKAEDIYNIYNQGLMSRIYKEFLGINFVFDSTTFFPHLCVLKKYCTFRRACQMWAV